MSWLPSRLPFFKGPARSQVPIVPTDEIVPVHLFDSTTALQSCILVWLFRFNERLDPDKLHDSLSRVFQREGWRKLGGRYRRRSNDGKLEIHIPKPFTAQRPPVHFTRETFNTRIDEHPLASKLPQATGKVATFQGPRAFNALAMGPGSPATYDDLIYDDKPQFSLHVTNFTDGTLVGLSHSHMTADLLGLTAVIEAWCQELAGESDKIKPFGGVEEDGMKGLYDPPTQEKHVLAGKELQGLGLGYWGLRAVWQAKSSRLTSRTLCIPNTTMEKLATQAKSQMTRQSSDTLPPDGRDAHFISDGDVLAALMCRLNAQSQSTMSRNIVTMMALDPRTRAPSAFRADVAYAGNSPTAVFFECSAQDAVDMSLGDLALRARQAIAAQATEEQMKAYAALSAESVRARNMNVMFGDRNMAFQLMSNWLKASLFEKIDFSPAIVEEASSAGAKNQHKRGHPVYYHSADPGDVEGPYIMHLVVVMGADHDGNIWMSCVLPENTWSSLVEFLDSL
ncbi:uncharacterized protein F5Z01DRAFT_24855 [Emericellopsis atlantica]|uniref:Uncharacterized protein n=1 Tax=Emericellopsis atlantica TaxID=2614577 RepID=A0A9P8CXU6_9HYPO|nr:uncharacterized protein F5Z01DRAFT_24855 [Emericellopsis atlantica]KAG9259096.1 hypothetical protein F5Z01DRAFT_24855 [Emericellopsis atlantica]